MGSKSLDQACSRITCQAQEIETEVESALADLELKKAEYADASREYEEWEREFQAAEANEKTIEIELSKLNTETELCKTALREKRAQLASDTRKTRNCRRKAVLSRQQNQMILKSLPELEDATNALAQALQSASDSDLTELENDVPILGIFPENFGLFRSFDRLTTVHEILDELKALEIICCADPTPKEIKSTQVESGFENVIIKCSCVIGGVFCLHYETDFALEKSLGEILQHLVNRRFFAAKF